MDPRKRTNVLMLIMYAVVLILVAGFFMEMHAQVDELQQDTRTSSIYREEAGVARGRNARENYST